MQSMDDQTVLPGRHNPKGQVNAKSGMNAKLDTAKSKVAIHLCSRFLPKFPAELLKMPHLKMINLGMNNIETLPKEIATFSKLTVVFVNLSTCI
jgi:hypothetical protein